MTTTTTRLDLWLGNKGMCSYCLAQVAPLRRQLDHVVPISRGGFDARWNLVPVCQSCNASKGKKVASYWVKWWLPWRLRQAGWSKERVDDYINRLLPYVVRVEQYHEYVMALAKEAP